MSVTMKLKILSCNIRVDVPADSESGNGWSDRSAFCAEVILAQNADLVCLQECQQQHFADLRQALPAFDAFGICNPALNLSRNNAIFYSRDRFEMVSAGGFWLSETPHIAGSLSWDSARPRFVNYVDLNERASGCQLRVWNLHFDHIGQIARENQARVFIEGAQILGDDLPQLLTGDFNCDATNPALDVVKAGGWQDTYTAIYGNEEPGITYHAFIGPEFAAKRAQDKFVGKMDFVFCKGPVKPLSASIIRDNRDGRYPSDHYFVSAEVEI